MLVTVSKRGNPIGKATVVDRSRPGQRCVWYFNGLNNANSNIQQTK